VVLMHYWLKFDVQRTRGRPRRTWVDDVIQWTGYWTCKASRFDSNSNRPFRFESDGPIRKFSNRSCLSIACRSQTTQTINGALVVQYTDSLAL